jgi:DNA-directed RNA polymerase alpha subunit/DNA-directed RNA polymerase subunit L
MAAATQKQTPIIESFTDHDGTLKFTVKQINVSLANAVRRTVLADIPTYCFRTLPHAENRVQITTNTTRLNNEIIKQRMGCIPIHIKANDPDFEHFNVDDYRVVLDVQNTGSANEYVTTKDFRMVNVKTGKELSESVVRRIFPPDAITGGYILIARLIPRLTQFVEGERLALTAEIGVGTARMDGMYNVVSTCAYKATQNAEEANKVWSECAKLLERDGNEAAFIASEKKNWFTMEANRYIVPDSFDFIIESIGVYSNTEIVTKACLLLIEKCKKLVSDIENANGDVDVVPSDSTLSNGYDITLQNEDYTLGKCIEYFIHTTHYTGSRTVSFCGFRKNHPHDTHSMIRVAFHAPTDVDIVHAYLIAAARDSAAVFQSLISQIHR